MFVWQDPFPSAPKAAVSIRPLLAARKAVGCSRCTAAVPLHDLVRVVDAGEPHFAGEADGVVAAGEISIWKNAQNLHQEQSLGTQPAGIPPSAPVKSHLDTDPAKPSAHGIHREGVGEGSLGRTTSMLTRLKLSTSPLFDLSASTCTATRCALR